MWEYKVVHHDRARRFSSYNSCLSGTVAFHYQAPHPLPTIDDVEMNA